MSVVELSDIMLYSALQHEVFRQNDRFEQSHKVHFLGLSFLHFVSTEGIERTTLYW